MRSKFRFITDINIRFLRRSLRLALHWINEIITFCQVNQDQWDQLELCKAAIIEKYSNCPLVFALNVYPHRTEIADHRTTCEAIESTQYASASRYGYSPHLCARALFIIIMIILLLLSHIIRELMWFLLTLSWSLLSLLLCCRFRSLRIPDVRRVDRQTDRYTHIRTHPTFKVIHLYTIHSFYVFKIAMSRFLVS